MLHKKGKAGKDDTAILGYDCIWHYRLCRMESTSYYKRCGLSNTSGQKLEDILFKLNMKLEEVWSSGQQKVSIRIEREDHLIYHQKY